MKNVKDIKTGSGRAGDEIKVLSFEFLRSLRDEILNIAAGRGAHDVRVFGSVVTGGAGENSDVDFLVRMEPGRSLLDLSGLCLDLEELLGCEVDVVTEKALSPYMRDRILSEATPL